MKWVKRIGITLFIISYILLLRMVYVQSLQHNMIYEGELEIYRDMCKQVSM